MSTKSDKTAQKNSVHFTLQGKGGVGKSLVSSLLAQYFQCVDGCTVKCVDTDPINQTLANYKALNAQHVKLMNGSKINERNFDQLMERLMAEDGIFVVDNGASSFVPLSNYLIENNVIAMLHEAGREVFIHSVLTGGQALMDTLAGFKILAEQTDIRNIVIWINEYFGVVEANGKTFTEMKVYTEHSDKVRGIVRIPERNQDTFGKDMELMVSKKLTFAEVLSGTDFALMAKQRLKTVQRDINTQLEAVGF
ncbi:conjugal transfer protein TraL (plasmid) [Verminephrobacter aporrectodeae subsp. tuberculatae]|uniref:conjugal transfer protein TraL n=1 Tax=Verminephrobacter aporrectodeae TaxID=1110389 RepID=UPI002237D28B|nr:conjugal transfer protein TraL [Verminephrobacter aporrectodeae]MCW5223632.1 conjugal transfer protein TraL [Verminephrobacter aporrectodeae subsp. tuberculatae]MCW5291474.1 conjugal transfer protein TraL [Verminephrobacter aporrectodeae subsp. tuberculatae]